MTTELLENPTELKIDYYLFLRTPNDIRFSKKIFLDLGINESDFFFSEHWWHFDKKNEELLRKYIKPFGEDYKVIKKNFRENETFESVKKQSKADYLYDKKIKKECELLMLLRNEGIDLPLESISDNDIKNFKLSEARKEEAINLLKSIQKLHHQQTIKEKQPLNSSPKNEFIIKFLNEYPKNYLMETPPEMPRLINRIDDIGGKPQIFIRKGIVAGLIGAGGVGKTHFLTHLGLSVALGGKFLDRFPIEKPGYVFIGLGENSEDDIHWLIHKSFKKLCPIKSQTSIENISKRVCTMSFCGKQVSFIENGKKTDAYNSFLSQLVEKEPEEGFSLIILDPISRFMGADAETDNASATLFVAFLEHLSLSLRGKPTVLIGHHMNKSGVKGTNTDQSAARGSSALTDALRLQMNLEKVQGEKNEFVLRVVKSNFSTPTTDFFKKDSNGNFEWLKKQTSNNKPLFG